MTQVAAIALFRTAVVTLSGLDDDEVLLGYSPQVPRLAVGHIYMVPIGDRRVGFPRRVSGTALNQVRVVDVQVDAVGTDACAALRAAHTLLLSDAPATRTLSAAGVATETLGEVLDISATMATAYEPRAVFTIGLGYTFAVSATPGDPATAVVLNVEATGALVEDVAPLATIPVP